MKHLLLLLCLILSGCYVVWDVPKVKHVDACTGHQANSYVYFCETPTLVNQR